MEQVQRIDYSDAPGGALHWKIHHSIGDGISLASLLLGCVDGGMPEMPGEIWSYLSCGFAVIGRTIARQWLTCVCHTR